MLKIGQYFLAMLPGMWREEEEIDGRGSLGQLGLRKISIYFLVFFFFFYQLDLALILIISLSKSRFIISF